jgi:hypothetical protein
MRLHVICRSRKAVSGCEPDDVAPSVRAPDGRMADMMTGTDFAEEMADP